MKSCIGLLYLSVIGAERKDRAQPHKKTKPSLGEFRFLFSLTLVTLLTVRKMSVSFQLWLQKPSFTFLQPVKWQILFGLRNVDYAFADVESLKL